MPPDTVVVSRPGSFGNPFTVEPVPGHARTWLPWRVYDHCARVGNEYDYFATRTEANIRAVQLYRAWLAGWHRPWNGQEWISIGNTTYSPRWILENAPSRLGGRDLACWCPLDQPCHGDVLLEIANASQPADGTR